LPFVEPTTPPNGIRSLGSLQEQLRWLGVRTATWVRLAGGLSFLLLALTFGFVAGRPGWKAASLPLALYCALVAVGTLLLRRRKCTGFLLPGLVVLDLLVCFLGHYLPLGSTPNPLGLASLGLGSFALVVLLAPFTVATGAQVYGTALLAAVLQGLLLRKVGADSDVLLFATLTLGSVGVLAAFGVRRLQELAARLVSEEADRSLAIEKGRALEQVNEQVALVNAELEEQHQRLVIAQREAEILTSLLVHDMKQPLTSVMALLELSAGELEQLPGSEAVRRDLQLARGQAERLVTMISDLLAISRLEKGQLEPQKVPVPVAALLEGVAGRTPHSKVKLTVDADPLLVARFDRELVERAVENLVANALAFVSAEGEVQLSARVLAGAGGAEELLLEVKNDGPAVPEEKRAGLFEKLVPQATARRVKGLGLYLCRLVAEAHHGRIGLEADARFPVSFVMHLPVQVERAALAKAG
jgi:signal transduction histidine kinase